MEKRESLNNAIIGSYVEFSKNNSLDIASIKEWLTQSLIQLYSENDANGFLVDYHDSIKLSKDDILELLINEYVNSINESAEDSIQDFFKRTLKSEIDNDGIESGKSTLKKYIETADVTAFGNSGQDDSKIAQYSSRGLINVMCKEYVENILEKEPKELQNEKKSSTIPKKEFYPYEFFEIGGETKQYDINRVVSAMESIRSGRIQTVGEVR